MNTSKGIRLWNRAKKIIPGGTQLLSKRSEMFLPDQWPSYYKKAKGIEIWDLDGKKYIDMSIMGIGSCILGYGDQDVNKAVKAVIDAGSMGSLNSPEEVELAELLIKLHPWADMARFARTGGEAMAIAVRLGRAYSKKDKVAFCGYHGWSDWYLAANIADKKNLDGHLIAGLKPAGVPRGLKDTSFPFHYNRIEELEAIVARHDIGAIIVEPIRHQEPEKNFLGRIRSIADSINAVMIFDEVSVGWRLAKGGAHLLYKVYPDIAVFSKAISNGYPMAAIIGKKEVMQTAQETFISSTYWTERIGPAAALATIKKLINKKVPAHLEHIGNLIGEGWKELAQKHSIKITVIGPPCLITFSFDYPNAQELKTLFTQEMLTRGYLASQTVYVSYSHKPKDVKNYVKRVDEVFAILAKAIKEGTVGKLLKGPVAHSGFERLT